MKRRCVIEEAVGETRAAVFERKKLVELYSRRWSDRDRPRVSDRFAGRITSVDKSVEAAFVDMGSGKDGFLRFNMASNAPRFQEGHMVDVEVLREPDHGKGAILKFLSLSGKSKPQKLSGLTLREFIEDRFPDIEFTEATVSAIDGACETIIAIPGGGDIAIEQTRALLAIDVDKGTAVKSLDVSLAACELIAQQVRLRGLGGLVVIDIPNLRQAKQRERVFQALNAAFANDPNTVKIASMSRFGTIELTRSKSSASLDAQLLGPDGEPTTETRALHALRQLEREARASAGAKLELTVPPDMFAWLDADLIGWRSAMMERLGARFSLAVGDELAIRVDR